ncbi:LuxR C-terminal-related transcriptional regulator [Kitasatospora sp. NPDC048540]|uniref:helix-turn-helix transcriptional regulator n=1 Tax=Kitasatospora sp. NPDC048540 TaxID=3155634 RepID=UPI0034046D56
MSTAIGVWSFPPTRRLRPEPGSEAVPSSGPRETTPVDAEADRSGTAYEPWPDTAFTRSLRALSQPSRRLLAAMAVVDQETPLPVLAVIADLADPSAALDDLVEAGFVTWFPLGLTEPVAIASAALRDAVYQDLPLSLRRTLHLAASEQISGVGGLRHALLGTRRRDPALAARLEEEAVRYHDAGDSEQAGTLLLWSADVSADHTERERRLRQVARWGERTPTAVWAAPLGQRLTLIGPSVERNLFLGRLATREARYATARALLDQAAALAGDLPAPARADVDLATAALHSDTAAVQAEEQVALSLLAHGGLRDEHRQWALYFAADAHGRIHHSPVAALHRLEALAPGFRSSPGDRTDRGLLLWARGTWLTQSARPAEALGDLHGALRSHDGAAERVLALTYAHLGYAYFQLGDWSAALREAHEAIRAADARNDRRDAVPATALAACITALRGDWDMAAAHTDTVTADHRALGPAHFGVFPALAAATLARARQEPSRMLTALTPVAAQPDLFSLHQLWWRPLHVEALVRTGRLREARPALAGLRTAAEPGARLTATLARLEGRLTAAEGDPATATDHLALGIERAAGEDSPLALAELDEEYGRQLLLQGARRRRSAIRSLVSAHERYRELGARPFAERCVRQLREVGVEIPQPATGDRTANLPTADRTPTALTEQQYHIARLASDGMTNQQIAHGLFVSPKTVEYHLGNIFAMLGITSRRQLPASLRMLTAVRREAYGPA